VGAVLAHALMEINPRFPAISKRQRQALLEVKEALEAQAPKGAAADPFEAERRAEQSGGPGDGTTEPKQ